MAKTIKNLAASVHQRLLIKARESARPFNELMQRFAIERFVYRISKSRHADRFFLKGALMLHAWMGPASRPTRDIDLLGEIDNSITVVAAAMKDACEMEIEPDGLAFHAASLTAERITEGAEYKGVRCRIRGNLGKAVFSLQIDIGFGDVIIPGPKRIVYPKILDFAPPVLNGYSMESAIAEKFQAMVKISDAPESFEDVVAAAKLFLSPLSTAIANRRTFHSVWNAPGPWR